MLITVQTNPSWQLTLAWPKSASACCQTPVLGLGLGVDFTFTLDNKNHNHNNNPHLKVTLKTKCCFSIISAQGGLFFKPIFALKP